MAQTRRGFALAGARPRERPRSHGPGHLPSGGFRAAAACHWRAAGAQGQSPSAVAGPLCSSRPGHAAAAPGPSMPARPFWRPRMSRRRQRARRRRRWRAPFAEDGGGTVVGWPRAGAPRTVTRARPGQARPGICGDLPVGPGASTMASTGPPIDLLPPRRAMAGRPQRAYRRVRLAGTRVQIAPVHERFYIYNRQCRGLHCASIQILGNVIVRNSLLVRKLLAGGRAASCSPRPCHCRHILCP